MEFKREKFSALDGHTKVKFTLLESEAKFYIEASVLGVTLNGVIHFIDDAELRTFARVLTDAQKERDLLTPKITVTGSGH